MVLRGVAGCLVMGVIPRQITVDYRLCYRDCKPSRASPRLTPHRGKHSIVRVTVGQLHLRLCPIRPSLAVPRTFQINLVGAKTSGRGSG